MNDKRFTRIVGLSEERRLPRAGKIHLGKKDEERGFPIATDHFVVPPEVALIYGPEPKELEVLLPCEELDEFFPVALKQYKTGVGLYCTGNMQRAWRVVEGGGKEEVSCPCEDLMSVGDRRPKCSRVGHLMFVLPRVGVGGVYQVDTGSVNSIVDIQSGVEYARRLIGYVAMVPFLLKLQSREMTVAGKKKRVNTLSLMVAPFETMNRIRESMAFLANASMGPRALLAAPSEEDESELAEVVDVEQVAPEEDAVDLEEPAEKAPAPPPAPPVCANQEPSPLSGAAAVLEGEARRLGREIGKTGKILEVEIGTANRNGKLSALVAEYRRLAAARKQFTPPESGSKAGDAVDRLSAKAAEENARLLADLTILGALIGMAPEEVAARVESVKAGGPASVKGLHKAWTHQAKEQEGAA